MRFGDGDDWTEWRDVEESIQCDVDVFGEDPARGKVKICQCRPEIRQCATEGEMCGCEGGRVRYGTGASWTEWETIEELLKAYPNDVSGDKILCENNVFGDPARGKVKVCECEESLPEEGIESPTGAPTATAPSAVVVPSLVCAQACTKLRLAQARRALLARTLAQARHMSEQFVRPDRLSWLAANRAATRG